MSATFSSFGASWKEELDATFPMEDNFQNSKAEEKASAAGAVPFKYYRRRSTNKAPRKRAFIANMTKQPDALTDSLDSVARGAGKNAHGGRTVGRSSDLTTPGPYPAAAAGMEKSLQLGSAATPQLASLPVMWPPVVYGTKQVAAQPSLKGMPSSLQASSSGSLHFSHEQQPGTFFDAELAAALANFMPSTSQAGRLPATMGMPTFSRAVTTTTWDQVVPSGGARAISTGMAAAPAVPAVQQQQQSMQSSQVPLSQQPQPQQQQHHHHMQQQYWQPDCSGSAAGSWPAASYGPAQLAPAPLPGSQPMVSMCSSGSNVSAATDEVLTAPAASPSSPEPAFSLQLDPASWIRLPSRLDRPVASQQLTFSSKDGEGLEENPGEVACNVMLGSGSHGTVYRGSLMLESAAWQPSPFKQVAVKVMRQGSSASDVLRSFQVEAELLPCLSHPNVVPLYYVNVEPSVGPVCIMQDLAAHGTLADLLYKARASSETGASQLEQAVLARAAQRLGLPLQQLSARSAGRAGSVTTLVQLSLLRDAAAGLDYLASLPQPIVHRDVKPDNMLIGADGMVMLADFGVARVAKPMPSATRTVSAQLPASSPMHTDAWSAPRAASWSGGHFATTAAIVPALDDDLAMLFGGWMSEDESRPVEQPAAKRLRPSGSAYPCISEDSELMCADLLDDSTAWLDELFAPEAQLQHGGMPPAGARSASFDSSSSNVVAAPTPVPASAPLSRVSSGDEDTMMLADHGSDVLDHDLSGTAQYAAPEDLCPGSYRVGPAADVFSLGYCIWESLSGQRPWAGMRAASMAQSVAGRGARPRINRGWSPRLQTLLRNMWQADPAARPSAAEVADVLDAEIRELARSVL